MALPFGRLALVVFATTAAAAGPSERRAEVRLGVEGAADEAGSVAVVSLGLR